MALPLLIPIGMAAAGLFGAGKAAKAVYDSSKAKDLAASAENIVKTTQTALNGTKKRTNAALEDYGAQKLEAFEKNITRFVDLFSQLKNVHLEESEELARMQVGKFTEVTIGELRHSCDLAMEAAKGLAAGTAGGACLDPTPESRFF